MNELSDLADLTLRQFADGRRRGDFSAEEVTRAVRPQRSGARLSR